MPSNRFTPWWRRYRRYMRSPAWLEKRAARLRLDKGLCVRCGARARHVHHVSYLRLGAEEMEDLLSLCLPCHEAEHGRKIPKRRGR